MEGFSEFVVHQGKEGRKTDFFSILPNAFARINIPFHTSL